MQKPKYRYEIGWENDHGKMCRKNFTSSLEADEVLQEGWDELIQADQEGIFTVRKVKNV